MMKRTHNHRLASVAVLVAAVLLGFGLTGCGESTSPTGQEGRSRKEQIIDANTRIITTENGLRIKVTDLGTLGGPSSVATSINEHGKIVGFSETSSGERHSFLWEDGEMTDLNTMFKSKTNSEATSINNKGQIVGNLVGNLITGSPRSGFLLENGKVTNLCSDFGPKKINENSLIVGTRRLHIDNETVDHAFLWEDGKLQDLGTLPGETISDAFSINENRQIVGTSGERSVMWENGTVMDLDFDGFSYGRDINDKGQIVFDGYVRPDQGYPLHGFLWEKGEMTDLGTLGGIESLASSINNNGQIVGSSDTSTPGQGKHAFLWENGEMTDLGTLEGNQSEASSINDQGQIVGDSHISLNQQHATLWEIME